jgi:hypothetical protein
MRSRLVQQQTVDPSLQGREREGGSVTPEEMNALWQALQRHNEQSRAQAMNERPSFLSF